MRNYCFLILFIAVCITSLYASDLLKECEQWASDDNNPELQCHSRPRYMWSICSESCYRYAKDMDNNCKIWAKEGECFTNPTFMQVQCAPSCGFSIGWNQEMRNLLGISITPEELDIMIEKCKYPMDLIRITDIMMSRLTRYLQGKQDILWAFAQPSGIDQILGISDVLLYISRLHLILAQQTNELPVIQWIQQQNNSQIYEILTLQIQDILESIQLQDYNTIIQQIYPLYQQLLRLTQLFQQYEQQWIVNHDETMRQQENQKSYRAKNQEVDIEWKRLLPCCSTSNISLTILTQRLFEDCQSHNIHTSFTSKSSSLCHNNIEYQSMDLSTLLQQYKQDFSFLDNINNLEALKDMNLLDLLGDIQLPVLPSKDFPLPRTQANIPSLGCRIHLPMIHSLDFMLQMISYGYRLFVIEGDSMNQGSFALQEMLDESMSLYNLTRKDMMISFVYHFDQYLFTQPPSSTSTASTSFSSTNYLLDLQHFIESQFAMTQLTSFDLLLFHIPMIQRMNYNHHLHQQSLQQQPYSNNPFSRYQNQSSHGFQSTFSSQTNTDSDSSSSEPFLPTYSMEELPQHWNQFTQYILRNKLTKHIGMMISSFDIALLTWKHAQLFSILPDIIYITDYNLYHPPTIPSWIEKKGIQLMIGNMFTAYPSVLKPIYDPILNALSFQHKLSQSYQFDNTDINQVFNQSHAFPTSASLFEDEYLDELNLHMNDLGYEDEFQQPFLNNHQQFNQQLPPEQQQYQQKAEQELNMNLQTMHRTTSQTIINYFIQQKFIPMISTTSLTHGIENMNSLLFPKLTPWEIKTIESLICLTNNNYHENHKKCLPVFQPKIPTF